MADGSLWPVVVGGVLTGLFTLGGIGVGFIATARRDAMQLRHERQKRRADKFEELVAAVYEFDHWLDRIRQREAFGNENIPETVSPFAKVQAISSVYFPQFEGSIRELDKATTQYRIWIQNAASKRIAGDTAQLSGGFAEVYAPYAMKRDELIGAFTNFASKEFQQA